jgi:O-antigen/teichoic acid export membrane protein
VFFGKEFCVLWAGPEYEGSYLIAVTLIVSSIIPLIQNVGIAILAAKNKHKFRSVAYFFIAILNLGVSIPLCIRFEGLGCAIGTAASMILGNGILINLYYRKLGIGVGSFWKSILGMCKGLMLPVAFGVVSLLVPFAYSWINLIVRIVLYTALYGVSMYRFAMNDSEKDMALGFAKKLKKAES